MRLHRIIAMCLVILAMTACNKQDVLPVAIINQLQVDGAVLPVHMHGNQQSRTAILVVHGGPGTSGILMREATGFHRLESEHLVVYYDQRGCGISEGNVDAESISVEQMSVDLNAVVQLVLASREVDQVFLLSLDWGAAAVVEYLTGPLKDNAVKGYIAVTPGFDAAETMAVSRQEILDIAEELLSDSDDTNDELAENIVLFYDENPVINRFNYEEHFRLMEALAGIILFDEVEYSGVEQPSYIKASLENNELFVLNNLTYIGGHFLESMNVEGLLFDIDVPVKIIWGFWDRLFPVSMSENYETAFGPASAGEIISVFPFSAHRPYLEEGERFFATVATWVTFYD